MIWKSQRVLQITSLGACLVIMLVCSFKTHAIIYGYPTGTININAPFPTVAGSPTLASGDMINVNSGTLATPASDQTGATYTLNMTSMQTSTGNLTIDVLAGATVSYLGSSIDGKAIICSRTDTTSTTDTISIAGNVNGGLGLFAIYLQNTNATPQDNYNVTLTGATASITSSIFTSGINSITLTINGTGGTPTITNTIDLVTNGNGSSLVLTNGAAFAPTGTLSNITQVTANAGTTMYFNTATSNIKNLTVAANGKVYVNSALNGLTTSDGNILNSGTMYIANNIVKKADFNTTTANISTPANTGTNIFTNQVTCSTTTYAINTHTAQMTDNINYGAVTFTNAGPIINATTVPTFNITYGGGYLSGNSYTLVTAQNNITLTGASTQPSPTTFLTWSAPFVPGGNGTSATIQTTVTRTPYNQVATTPLTQSIGVNLEAIGSTITSSNPNAEMLTLLDAVEKSQTASTLNAALEQLSPLISAPLYGYQVQNSSMRQVELRLAAIRNRTAYIAGDIAQDNHLWGRGFGGFANQKSKDDSLGYYGTGGGYAAGYDRNLDTHYTVGAAGMYAKSRVQDKISALSNTLIQSYIGIVYGSYNFSEVSYCDWLISVIANNFTAARTVALNGYVQTANSTYGSQQIAAKGVWGKSYAAFNFLQLTPEASAQYMFAKQYDYNESNGNGIDLNISRDNCNIVELGLGGKIAVPILLNPAVAVPEIHGMVLYNPVNGKQNTTFAFLNGGGPMTSNLTPSRTGLELGAAFTIAVESRFELKFNIDLDIQDRYKGYSMYLDLRFLL